MSQAFCNDTFEVTSWVDRLRDYLLGYIQSFDLFPECNDAPYITDDAEALAKDFQSVGFDLHRATQWLITSSSSVADSSALDGDEFQQQKAAAARKAIEAIYGKTAAHPPKA